MQKLRAEKGITLIALVITIIVMLILVGVSVTVALNGGLFSTAQKATGDTKAERDNELALSDGKVTINGEEYNSIDEYVNGNEDEKETVAAGAYYADGTFKDWEALKIEGKVTDTEVKGYGDGFANDNNLIKIIIPNTVTTTNFYTFGGCKNLTSVTLLGTKTNMAGTTFSACTNLSDITYSGTIEQWNDIINDDTWNDACPEITVHCIDGDITIPAHGS